MKDRYYSFTKSDVEELIERQAKIKALPKVHLVRTAYSSGSLEVVCGIKFKIDVQHVLWGTDAQLEHLKGVSCKNCQKQMVRRAKNIFPPDVAEHLKDFFVKRSPWVP